MAETDTKRTVGICGLGFTNKFTIRDLDTREDFGSFATRAEAKAEAQRRGWEVLTANMAQNHMLLRR